MRIALVINCYISTRPGESHGFDHPTRLDRFEEENTLAATLASVKASPLPSGHSLTLYLIGSAVNGKTGDDGEVRRKLENLAKTPGIAHKIFTNSDVLLMAQKAPGEQSRFYSVEGYPELRNLGFILPLKNGEDVIIQLDDDEIVPKDYFQGVVDLLEAHPDKALFTAPYSKNGTIRILTPDDLKTWQKFSSMDKDMARLEAAREPVETLFGFGGNMIVRSAFARSVFYPLEVPRGEDFSLLLVSRLLHANGLTTPDGSAPDGRLKAWFVNRPELTIDHRPPAEAKKDFIFYLEKNLRRFILEWLMLRSQEAFPAEDLEPLSSYQYAMLGVDDYREKISEIYCELRRQRAEGQRPDLSEDDLDQSEARLFSFFEEEKDKPPRFKEYLRLREQYQKLVTEAPAGL